MSEHSPNISEQDVTLLVEQCEASGYPELDLAASERPDYGAPLLEVVASEAPDRIWLQAAVLAGYAPDLNGALLALQAIQTWSLTQVAEVMAGGADGEALAWLDAGRSDYLRVIAMVEGFVTELKACEAAIQAGPPRSSW